MGKEAHVRATAALPQGIGLSFTERMSGTFRSNGAAPAALEFVLTIAFDDLGAMFASREHAGRIAGIVTAPTLSPRPLTTADGVFNLLVEDPSAVHTRELRYEFVMRSA